MTSPAIERVHSAQAEALDYLRQAIADLQAGRTSPAIYDVMEDEDALGELRRWLEINTDATDFLE